MAIDLKVNGAQTDFRFLFFLLANNIIVTNNNK